MGCSPDASVIYGFAIGGEGYDCEAPQCPEDVLEDWESVYAARTGLVDPFVDDETYERSPKNKEACKQHWTDEREAVKDAKCNFASDGDMCSGYTTTYITHKDLNIRCDWDRPTEITPEQITPKPEWYQEMKDFCEFMGIPWQEPKVIIVCSYG